MPIYLMENHFWVDTTNYNSDLLARFGAFCAKHLNHDQDADVDLFFSYTTSEQIQRAEDEGVDIWGNLLTFLHRIHADEILTYPNLLWSEESDATETRRHRTTEHLVGTMFAMACASIEEPWEVVEKMFLAMRPSLVVLNTAWEDPQNRIQAGALNGLKGDGAME